MLNAEISFRQATAGDWPAVASLLESNKLPLDGAQDHLPAYLLAVSGGKIVGSAGVELYGDIALLRSVAVTPGLQKRGVGKALVDWLIQEAKGRHVRSLFLLTVTAPEYFSQFGFKRGDIANAPAALKASAELQGACPACAAFMSLPLSSSASAIDQLPVAVLGAGPVGLAAAAKLIERGIPFVVLEASERVGANLLDYGHVRLFSSWQYNVDHSMAKLLEPTDWKSPPTDELPLAREIVEKVLQPFAELPQVASSLRLGTKVVSVSREGFDKVKSAGRDKAPFIVRSTQDGKTTELRARAVIDSTGTWNTANPLGSNGLPAVGEVQAASQIHYGIPDVLGKHRARYEGKRTLVVGAGHSAANALLYLAELAKHSPTTQLVWLVRSPTLTRVFGGGNADALPARGQLGSSLRQLRDTGALEFVSGVSITELRSENGALTVIGLNAQRETVTLAGIDEIICSTGQRPNLSLTNELRVKLDLALESTEALGPLIDPNVHSCGTVRPHGHRELSHPELGLYTIGVKSYGRAPTFLMATGFEQARSVVAAIAGDLESADRVELELPETGVCSTDAVVVQKDSARSSCSTSPAPAAASGCGTKSCGAPAAVAPVIAKAACCS